MSIVLVKVMCIFLCVHMCLDIYKLTVIQYIAVKLNSKSDPTPSERLLNAVLRNHIKNIKLKISQCRFKDLNVKTWTKR